MEEKRVVSLITEEELERLIAENKNIIECKHKNEEKKQRV